MSRSVAIPFRKSYAPHVRDWKSGDPTWKDGLGKGLIGAMNYLASKGLNSQSLMTYTIHGDDRNVSPYIDSEDRTRLSIPKLAQWEILFEHMDRLGLYMEFKLMETENDWDMDGGDILSANSLGSIPTCGSRASPDPWASSPRVGGGCST